mgnify:CR=1 FL=1
MANKKIWINVYRDTFCWKGEKPTEGAIEHTYHTKKSGATNGLFDREYYNNEVQELKFSQPLRLKKDYLYSLELTENGIKKLDLMKDAQKKQKYLIKKELSKTLKNQQKISKNINSNIAKLLKILNK